MDFDTKLKKKMILKNQCRKNIKSRAIGFAGR